MEQKELLYIVKRGIFGAVYWVLAIMAVGAAIIAVMGQPVYTPPGSGEIISYRGWAHCWS